MKKNSLVLILSLAVGATGVAGCSGTSDALARPTGTPASSVTSSSDLYALPSDGWKAGDGSLTALTGGKFHAGRVGDQVCAWLGDSFRPMLWPDGYKVRLNPAELIAPNGTVVAHDGDEMSAGGGGHDAKSGTPCAQPGEWTWDVEGALGIAKTYAPAPSTRVSVR
jgi:hypothetical protein